ncbi:MAG: type II secretion system F family protein [Granulosicoccus sp.]|nr:type II secretion system F family protein [Granulosicoccus sp.]
MSTSFQIAFILGVFIATMIWQIGTFLSRLPVHPRQYLDRPALGFRLIWLFIRVVVFFIDGRIPNTYRKSMYIKLKRAGVDFTLTCEEFIASQLICSLLLCLITGFLLRNSGILLFWCWPVALVAGFLYPTIWLRDRTHARRTEILRALPFYLDVITLAVESGSNLAGGLSKAVQKSPDTALRSEISRVLRDIRSGKTRTDALHELADRTSSPEIGQIVAGLIQAEKTGSNLGPVLRVQAEQLRMQRFQRAEKKAAETPVKLLAPIFIFIFPTAFITLGFIVVSKGILDGVFTWPLVVWAYYWPGGF